MNEPQLAYICFDVVPSPKGASIHIEAFAKTLADAVGHLQLVTVSPTTAVEEQVQAGIGQVSLPALGPTLIDRVLFFRQQLMHWFRNRSFESIQVRSIYEGFPIALDKQKYCKFLIFEVNGLPSIELKYRYPNIIDDRELLQKLVAQEDICLRAADRIVTPSSVTRDYLVQRGIAPDKIAVIPNGVDLTTFSYQPPSPRSDSLPFQLLYFGTLSAWQGVAIAIEALALIQRDIPAELTIIGPSRPGQIEALQKLANKLGVAASLTILNPMPQAELVRHIHQADAILAPLTANDRNLVQGCCPLKVLEGMASGTPVITSDLLVVQDLGLHGVHFLSVRPGSAKAIKDAVLQLQADPELRKRLAIAARQQVEQYYTWERAGIELVNVYRTLLNETKTNVI